ncbi:hypothetical protein RRF57_009994 [Xylaria bambusicola]|uniref:Uncharacterized protein n=1 Tax=Xylaria bambusicola TaxID=326684 RepID=A0AAN7Z2C0_9PEZI
MTRERGVLPRRHHLNVHQHQSIATLPQFGYPEFLCCSHVFETGLKEGKQGLADLDPRSRILLAPLGLTGSSRWVEAGDLIGPFLVMNPHRGSIGLRHSARLLHSTASLSCKTRKEEESEERLGPVCSIKLRHINFTSLRTHLFVSSTHSNLTQPSQATMANEKSVLIEFTQEQVVYFNTNGFKLCFSSGMGDKDDFNVIAYSDTIAQNVSISWVDEFSIAATKSEFMNGAKITVNTGTADIGKNQTYTLPPTWANGTVSPETHPNDAFRMVNKTTGRASAVVYKKVNGKPTAFYISAVAIEPQGSEMLSPKSNISLWFEKSVETGTMVSKNSGNASVFDFRGVNSKTVHYDSGRFVDGGISGRK